MKKVIVLLLFSITLAKAGRGQSAEKADSNRLLWLNQMVDTYVVERNLGALDTIYATDFVFSHGSGRVEGKKGWLTTVGRANYSVRQHDSVKVELHGDIAIVKGKMSIKKINKDKTDSYHLSYIRVYALRNNSHWQLISHNTTHEYHD
jgi:hypothetical protein